MMYSFSTCGSGRRHTLSVASASAFTRVSLYFQVVPGAARLRVSHSSRLSDGRSAQSGLPQSVPSQSLVWRSMWFQVMVRLWGVAKRSMKSALPMRSALLPPPEGSNTWIGGT
jgi:hypothetical protein